MKGKKSRRIILLVIIIFLVSFISYVSSNQSGLDIAQQITGAKAYSYILYLYNNYGNRDAGTIYEHNAGQFIKGIFEGFGYQVEEQQFSYSELGIDSSNIIATKPGINDQTVIVGAHYDCLYAIIQEYYNCSGENLPGGAVDNASGVGIMLEIAEILAYKNTLGTIKFIAFGAEEYGLLGSSYYTSQMTLEEIDNTLAFINIDMIGGGDYSYVYAGNNGNPGWVRDLALNISSCLGYNIQTSPDTPFFAQGEIGDWGDHAPFKDLGIPIAFFNSFNWDLMVESQQYGWISHSCFDTPVHITQTELEEIADVAGALIFELSKNALPNAEKGIMAQAKKYIGVKWPGAPL